MICESQKLLVFNRQKRHEVDHDIIYICPFNVPQISALLVHQFFMGITQVLIKHPVLRCICLVTAKALVSDGFETTKCI